MRVHFLRTSVIALAALALIAGTGASRNAAAQTAAPTAAPSLPAAPTSAVTSPAATMAVTMSGTMNVSTMAATSASTNYPICDPNATPAATTAAATVNATASATPEATSAATSAATMAATAAATVGANAGYLGVGAKQVLTCGALILDINPGYAADKAGVKTGDVVVAVNGTLLTSLDQFRILVQSHNAGDTITLTIQRAGQQLQTPVTLTAIPNTTLATQSTTQAATAASGTNPTPSG